MVVELAEQFPFSVDTWTSYSARKKYHFLTHAHKDHAAGIASHASYPIYCTSLTKQIILLRYPMLDEGIFVELEVGEPELIYDIDQPFTVTAFDANHCPGAIMLYFEGQFGNVLHTGDCRLSSDCLSKLPRKLTVKTGKTARDCLDCLYLDCTFGKDSFKMPRKYSAVKQVLSCIWKHPGASTVYLACDLLGQEEILMEISKTFGSKIYVDKSLLPEYYAIVSVVVPDLLSEDSSCRFHVCEGFPRLYDRAKAKFSEAERSSQPKPLFIRPSAQWYTCEERLEGVGSELIPLRVLPIRGTQSVPKEAERDQFGVWHVCYSMHSSKEELEEALEVLNPKEVISTTPNCRVTELQHVREKISNTRIWSENNSDLRYKATKSSSHSGTLSSINHDLVPEASVFHVVKQMSSVTKQEKQADLHGSLEQKHSHKHLQLSSPSKPIPLFGITRYNLPPSPPMSFSDGEDAYRSQECMASSHGEQLSSHHLSENIKHYMPGGENPPKFTSLSGARELHKGRQCLTSEKDSEEGGTQPSARRALHKQEESEKPLKSTEQSRKEECDTGSPCCRKGGIIEDNQADCMPNVIVEETCSSFDNSNPRTLHESVRKMYRSLHVPVPHALPSLLELVNHTKRPKLRSSPS